MSRASLFSFHIKSKFQDYSYLPLASMEDPDRKTVDPFDGTSSHHATSSSIQPRPRSLWETVTILQFRVYDLHYLFSPIVKPTSSKQHPVRHPLGERNRSQVWFGAHANLEPSLSLRFLGSHKPRFVFWGGSLHTNLMWNVGNARLQGLPKDVLGGDPTGVLFDWVNSAFFFSYILVQVPATLTMKLFDPRIWMGCMAIGKPLMCCWFYDSWSWPTPH